VGTRPRSVVLDWRHDQAADDIWSTSATARHLEGARVRGRHHQRRATSTAPGWGAAAVEVIAAVWSSVDRLAHAYAAAEGVGWHDHDSRLFTGVDRFDRTSLVAEWLPAVEGFVDRLRSGIRVLDVGCGLGGRRS
jgi:2-polyprenyl-3-methyl-5-hydroxy-6-metoxy-1,4-benzoquinol methylase